MTESEAIKGWNKWVEQNYPALVKAAKGFHQEPRDLVHHTYLRILRLKGVSIKKVLGYPMPYFRRAMFVEATRGKFKEEYEIMPLPYREQISDYDLSHAFMLENFELAVDRLSWFDKTVLRLFVQGYNLTEVGRESGINPQTFHTSLHRSRVKLKEYFKEHE